MNYMRLHEPVTLKFSEVNNKYSCQKSKIMQSDDNGLGTGYLKIIKLNHKQQC